jgi:hypothetical protein
MILKVCEIVLACGVGLPIFGEVPNHTERNRNFSIQRSDMRRRDLDTKVRPEEAEERVTANSLTTVPMDRRGELVWYTASADEGTAVLVL